MAVLEPKLAILDETDSGLDIDALRIVADGVNTLKRPDNATIVVTHYQRLLNYIVPDFVHVLAGGRIVTSGGKELALELEEKGYDWLLEGAVGVIESYLTAASSGSRVERLASTRAPTGRGRCALSAITRFEALGFPTTKNEDWHFTLGRADRRAGVRACSRRRAAT